MKKMCKYCRYGQIAYRLTPFGYNLTNNAYCTKTEKLHLQRYTCDNWKTRPRTADLSAERFDSAIADIEYLLDHCKKYE